MTRRRINPTWALMLALLLIMAAGFGYAIATFYDRAETGEQAAQASTSLVDQVQAACRVEDRNPDQDALRSAGLCDTADETKDAIDEVTDAAPDARVIPVPGPTGPSGRPGRDGTDGTDGADGTNGRSAAFTDIVAAVTQGFPAALEAACGGSCKGEPGKDGRGVADVVCGADGRWRVTYTDGETRDAGACRADDPTPTPEPTEIVAP